MDGRFVARWRWPLAATAVLLFALMLVDEFARSDEPFTIVDLLFEALDIGLLVGCTVVSAVLVLRTEGQAEESRLLREEMLAVRAESGRWRKEMDDHLKGFGVAIQKQLQAWNLSRAEQDVALLLLKGFSHKEIARLRRTSESTIRQQAVSIYHKANLSGRAALSAFFLDGLHLPDPDPDGAALPLPATVGAVPADRV